MASKSERSNGSDSVSEALAELSKASGKITNAAGAAKQLELSIQRVSILCQQGRIVGAVKIGRTWMMPQSSVDEFAKIKRVHGRRLSLDKDIPSESSTPKKTAKKKPKNERCQSCQLRQ